MEQTCRGCGHALPQTERGWCLTCGHPYGLDGLIAEAPPAPSALPPPPPPPAAHHEAPAAAPVTFRPPAPGEPAVPAAWTAPSTSSPTGWAPPPAPTGGGWPPTGGAPEDRAGSGGRSSKLATALIALLALVPIALGAVVFLGRDEHRRTPPERTTRSSTTEPATGATTPPTGATTLPPPTTGPTTPTAPPLAHGTTVSDGESGSRWRMIGSPKVTSGEAQDGSVTIRERTYVVSHDLARAEAVMIYDVPAPKVYSAAIYMHAVTNAFGATVKHQEPAVVQGRPGVSARMRISADGCDIDVEARVLTYDGGAAVLLSFGQCGVPPPSIDPLVDSFQHGG